MPPVDLAVIAAAAENAGFSEAIFEHRFHAKRRWRFDLAWPALKVAFEREGGTWSGSRHTSGTGYRNDAEKYNTAAIASWIVIRATVDMIRDGTALTQLLEALEIARDARRATPE